MVFAKRALLQQQMPVVIENENGKCAVSQALLMDLQLGGEAGLAIFRTDQNQ
jgi:hypothetical protein